MEKNMRVIFTILIFTSFVLYRCSSEEIKQNESPVSSYISSNPNFNYVLKVKEFLDFENGSILQYSSRLIWQKCSIGQEKDCSGEAKIFNWDDANKQCSTLKISNKKWRLPTKYEIYYLGVEKNENLFPNTQKAPYWTSSIEDKLIWSSGFYSGYEATLNKTNKLFVRCVNENSSIFLDNKNGTIKDTDTNLTWQKCGSGLSLYDNLCLGKHDELTWKDALSYCDELNLANRKWRLPKIDELQTLSNMMGGGKELRELYFSNSGSQYGGFWSASIHQEYKEEAWYSDYKASWSNQSRKKAVRCVSDQ